MLAGNLPRFPWVTRQHLTEKSAVSYDAETILSIIVVFVGGTN
jgi:hypothetical protein